MIIITNNYVTVINQNIFKDPQLFLNSL